jgi:hypothetical protein
MIDPKFLEEASRLYCHLSGKDPDAPFDEQTPEPNWQVASHRLVDHLSVVQALMMASQEMQKGKEPVPADAAGMN